MNIYIIDYLGTHCGMHYYNDAFAKVLHDIPDTQTYILSNYKAEAKKEPFFYFQYQGSTSRKIRFLLLNYLKLFFFILGHRSSYFIYLTYGNTIDLPFIWIISLLPKHIIDIHEVIAQNIDNNKRLKYLLQKLYRKRIRNVIVHSTRTDKFLNDFNYKGNRFYVPHFRYQFKTECNLTKVQNDITEAINKEKINILFFGNINISKGIDIFIDSINNLPPYIYQRINIIIAGKDNDHAIEIVKPKHAELFHIILRHINDNELIYLYQKSEYVVLPYRKTSQSGILEMAFYFRKPIIASCIPYFTQILNQFPSFGRLSGNSAESLSETISDVVKQHSASTFFNENDWSNYIYRSEVENFKKEFSNWIISFKK